MAEEFKRLDRKLVYHERSSIITGTPFRFRTGTSQNGILSGIRARLRSFLCERMESF